MSIIKGIFVYTFIFIGLLLGIGVILIGIMYFFPQVSVFGYKFYNGNNNGIIYEVLPDGNTQGKNTINRNPEIINNVDAVEIDANKWNIQVVYFDNPVSDIYFRVEFTRSITGFVSTKTPTPTFDVLAEKKALTGESEEKNVMTFKVNEPKGAYFNRNATLVVWIPHNVSGGVLENLNIKSGSGKVEFAQKTLAEGVEIGDPTLNVNYVKLTDKSGALPLRNTNVLKKMSLDCSNSTFSVDRNLACDVELDCNRGKYEFGDLTSPLKNSNIVVNAVNANMIFKNIEGDLTLNTDYGFFRANTIYGDFSALSHNVKDKNNACDMNIQKILGSVIIENGSGKLNIGQVGEVTKESTITDMKIDTKSGNLSIKNCFAKKVDINSTSGVIRLDNCLSELNVNTTYGSVYVHFMKKDAEVEGVSDTQVATAVEKLKERKTNIITGDGKGNGAIEVYNTQGVLNLNSKGRGKVVAEMDNVVGANEILGDSSNIDIVVPDSSKFWLKWQAGSSADLRVVTFVSTEKKSNSEMNNYDQTHDAVFMGGNKDGTVQTSMNVKAGKNLVFYSKGHKELV